MRKICISKDWKFTSPELAAPVQLDLPHDFAVSLPRDPNCPSGEKYGYFTGSHGTYEKFLTLGNDAHVILDVDGAYMCSRVCLNENQLAFHPHGYTPFLVDLTPTMRKNAINKLTITTQHLQPSTRWYSGAGLYRDVFLWTGGQIRVEPWDLFITTKTADYHQAQVSAALVLSADISAQVQLQIQLLDPDGVVSAQSTTTVQVTPGKNPIELMYNIFNPKLWSTETPQLYTFAAQILAEGICEDELEQTFGIRTISFDPEHGFRLNGVSMKLQGGCIHHDHGGLGAAAFPAAEQRKLSKLKAAGFNAIRTAHNPPSLALLEACDRMGILVMDEAFDVWNMPKVRLDYSMWFADWWERDLRSMILRDRNHPCVISYSIGNEIEERGGWGEGAKWSRLLSDEVRKHDATRPVTSGICGIWYSPEADAPKKYQDAMMEGYDDIGDGAVDSSWPQRTEGFIAPLDIVGYNYLYKRYALDHTLYPNRVIWGSESQVLSFYHSWKAVMENSHVLGDFTWTAYDNLGEVGGGRFVWDQDISPIALRESVPYPWRSCFQGDFDLAGFRRPQSYFRESIWRPDCEPRIFTTHPAHNGKRFSGTNWHWYDVCSTWTFDDAYVGKPVKTDVYTDADEIRFFLNGRTVATAKPEAGIASADILYEKGELTAISYKDCRETKRFTLRTVGAPAKLRVEPEKPELSADNRDLCYFDISILDERGDLIPDATNELVCRCDGGELLAIFSGDPENEDQYGSDRCHAFFGNAVAVVRTKTPGTVTLTVDSTGLASAQGAVYAK